MHLFKGALAAGLLLLPCLPAGAQTAAPNPAAMTFFVTSTGIGRGADLGGLAGADAHCQRLAAAAGAGNRTWRAYLSTQGQGAVNARDRIGSGPGRTPTASSSPAASPTCTRRPMR